METRLSRIFKVFQNRFFTHIVFSMPWGRGRSRLSNGLSFLFFGFLLGNLFGTLVPILRLIFPWDGFIVLIILFFMELISSIRYQRSSREFLGIWKVAIISTRRSFSDTRGKDPTKEGAFDPAIQQSSSWNSPFFGWNSFKIGFLLGFFIDAYKVGS